MTKINYLFIIVLSLFMTACQVSKQQNSTSIVNQWQNHQHDLEEINTFLVNGSIAHFSNKTRSYGRFLINQQSDDRFDIKLTTPVGTSILSLKVEPNYAQLIDKDGNNYNGNNIEDLMSKVSNVNIPLNSLHNWLKGYSNNSSADKLDKSGRLTATEFIQNNNKWQLKIPSYSTYTFKNKKIDLPSSIELNHNDELIRLKISNWILR